LLECGDLAPDFDLPVLIGGVKQRFHLRELREKQNLVLAFYPSNWEPLSAEQFVAYQVERAKFKAQNAEVVGITVDSIMNITSWEREIGPFDYFLCSDFWPHGQVCEQYGVLAKSGFSERAVFVVDQIGKVRYKRIYRAGQKPDLEETLVALRNL
jgi:peroxiredoxin